MPKSVADGYCPNAHQTAKMPDKFRPWWIRGVVSPNRKSHSHHKIAVENLLITALNQSPQIRVLSSVPLAEETRIQEARSEFDRRAFVESEFVRTSDPVGNELTTGGPPRFREENWSQKMGVRRKTLTGASVELSQQIGYQNNNSIFFVPEDQGNARLVLNFTQPLLRGGGKSYNASRTMLAQIDTAIAWEKFSAELQAKLVEITRTYWQLYVDRSVLQQRERLYQQACGILAELESRQKIDATRSQVFRARAAVAARYSDLARAQQNIKNTEARIRELTGVMPPPNQSAAELIPVEYPNQALVQINMIAARRTALKHRPEMIEAFKAVRAAGVRLNVSRKDLLPTLDLVTEMYVSGIEGRSNISQAFSDQFTVGEPSYTVGLKFEVPLGRRGPKANYQRQLIEMRRLASQADATALAILTEVDIAAGEVNALYREMQGKYNAMVAAEEDVNHLHKRWQFLPGEDRSASFVLEDLLDAQDRLAVEQVEFTQSQAGYTMALVEMKRVMGVLLQCEEVTQCRVCDDGAPQLILSKPRLGNNVNMSPKVPTKGREVPAGR
ncbi:MAG: TolC family protein [Planctomycetia bacterium]